MNLALGSNTSTEAVDQFVSYRLWSLDGRGHDFWIGASVQVAHFLDAEIHVGIGQTNSVVAEIRGPVFRRSWFSFIGIFEFFMAGE